MKKLALLSTLLAAGLTISMLRQLVWSAPARSDVGTTRQVTPQGAASARSVQASTPVPRLNMRARVADVIDERVEPMSSEAEVDAYLRELTNQARRNQRVSALEVEPGMEAISRLAPEIGMDRADARRMEFGQIMAELSAELDGREKDTEPPPATAVELSERLDQLETRALDNSRVTASEVEDGLAAIAALDLDQEQADEMSREFTERMAALSETLDREQGRPGPDAE